MVDGFDRIDETRRVIRFIFYPEHARVKTNRDGRFVVFADC